MCNKRSTHCVRQACTAVVQCIPEYGLALRSCQTGVGENLSVTDAFYHMLNVVESAGRSVQCQPHKLAAMRCGLLV